MLFRQPSYYIGVEFFVSVTQSASAGMETARKWAKEGSMSLQVFVALISLAVVVLIAAGVFEQRDDATR